MRRIALALLVCLVVRPALADPIALPPQPAPGVLCREAIATAARAHGVPPALMAAVGRVESGRRDPLSGEVIKDRPSRILRPGMTLTIEPGLYVSPAPDVPEMFWNTGIRIEDDAVVTDDGCELITRGVPVEPDAIEALMR